MSSDATPDYLTDPRYVRWQGIAMAQFTVAIALLSALSISMLAAASALVLRNDLPVFGMRGISLGLSMLLLAGAVFLCLITTVSRTLDFRITARKVREKQRLRMFGMNSYQLGKVSWACFWSAMLLFLGGSLLFLSACTHLIAPRLLCTP